ncbi:MAG TPA: hypothetical protein DCQ64_30710 [Candidatus Rokubacteria bacterium]|nr:hypothetical protein [Candidatus Rokubacteria bacterium]
MAGTVTIVHNRNGAIGRIVATCTGDASDGTFPATALPPFSGRILALRTNPGATAPTDNYDITLVDDDAVDRLQGVGANRATATSQEAAVVYLGTAIHPPVAFDETLTLTLAGNSVNSAIIVIAIVYAAN